MKNITRTFSLLLIVLMTVYSCKKSPKGNVDTGGNNNNTGSTNVPPASTGNTAATMVKGTDPSVAATQGFFLENSWMPKTFTAPATVTTVSKPDISDVGVSIDLSKVITKTSPYLFGNNTNPFMGQVADQPVLINNIAALSPNILRFPGGSLSDIYFWNAADGQSPADAPAQLLDASGNASAAGYWYGNNPASWTMSLDNYYKSLQLTNSTGLITVNYGYARYGTGPHPDQAAAHLAANWVRYDKGRTKYWEVGNECFGNWEAGYRINTAANLDGQPAVLTPQTYGTHFKVFADSMHAAAAEVGATIQVGIVLTEANDNSNSAGVSNWNAGVLSAAGNSPDFYVVHNYYTPYNQNSTADVILNTPVSATQSMLNWVKSSAQGAGVTQKPVALDEYNIFATGSNQMVSDIAGIHGVMVLGEALKNQVSMAARWDLANSWDNGNDMGMFNNSAQTSGAEPGAAAWNPRPAYYYYYYFQKYFGDRVVSSTVIGSSDILSYASSFTSGQAGVVLVNKGSADHTVALAISNFVPGTNYYFYVLQGGTDGTFSRKVVVNGHGPSGASGGPDNFTGIAPASGAQKDGIRITIPAYSVIYLVADTK
jgi:hypothetical protein